MPNVWHSVDNPFRPGAGHMPPYLAGRSDEQETFKRMLRQTVITDNLIITGLRGVGKSVLLESLKPIARSAQWLWVGDDLTESKSLTEERIADSIVNDLSLALSPIFMETQLALPVGFGGTGNPVHRPLDYADLRKLYDESPGLPADRLKTVLRFVGSLIMKTSLKGIVFAYDEAQNMGDRAQENEYPLSLLLDVFQSIQRHPGGLPFLLVLTGLPTLFPKLNATRTYTERMFDVITLDRLGDVDCREAITRPIMDAACPFTFDDEGVDKIVQMSGGYPFFIQFICKEYFDAWIYRGRAGASLMVPEEEILRKLDIRFFSARWDNASDRQREFMTVVAALPNSGGEFKVQDVVEQSETLLDRPFNANNAQLMLTTLMENDFVFRNRRGRYSLAVPLLDRFILRQAESAAALA